MTAEHAMTAGKARPCLWTPGDWNAFFGFGTNILVNMLVLTGLLRFVLKMPDSLVFGRILPALGLMMCLSTMYYALLAYRLALKTGRSDVCALPSGVSVPHMFIVTFVIMLPITLKTNDPIKGWEAGLVWVFFQSFILMIGGFIAPFVRKITPRAALLGTLAGVSITFISMRPALEMFMTPVIGMTCFAIIMVSWFGGFKYPKGIPAGPRRHRGRHGDRLGLEPVRHRPWRPERREARLGVFELRLLGAAAGDSITCSRASSFSASSWSPPFRSASTTWSRRWTTSRARRRPATPIRPPACSPPTASSA